MTLTENMNATLIRTKRLYRLDEPITVYSAKHDEYRYVGRIIEATWRDGESGCSSSEPLEVKLTGPTQQVFRSGEWKTIGGAHLGVPVPKAQQPAWLNDGDV